MPQGLDLTAVNIRSEFGLVKTQTQDIWCRQGPRHHMLVDYLWTTLVRSWAHGGYHLWETRQNPATEPSPAGPGSEAPWKPHPSLFLSSGRSGRPTGSSPTPACPRCTCSAAS